MSPPKILTVSVPESAEGSRLDKFLSTLPEVGSRGKAAKLLEENRVLVNGKAAKASLSLKAGDAVQADLPEARDTSQIKPLHTEIHVVFEDDDLMVINKPAGMVVHPAAGHADDTLVNALVARTESLAMGFGEHRPGLVHRLDKDTTGLLVVAKNDATQEHLSQQFQERSTHRSYQALIFGEPKSDAFVFRSWLTRHPTDRKRFASVRDSDRKVITDPKHEVSSGKWAVTHAQILRRKHGLSFARLRLETGRTHQIRVHLSEAGYPLVGDGTYGAEKRLKGLPSVELRRSLVGWPRFFLHARELGFKHPRTGEDMRFEIEWPDTDLEFLKKWGFME